MPRTLSPCGTEAAYRRHLRHGEEPCDDCKRASALARGRRKGEEKAPPEQPKVIDMVSREVILARAGDDDGVLDLSSEDMRRELSALFLILKGSLKNAMPREVASIAREMRNTLEMLQGLSTPESAGPASFTDQLAQALAMVAQQERDRDDDEAEGVSDGDEDRSTDSEDRGTA
jgi:hypothetical protein